MYHNYQFADVSEALPKLLSDLEHAEEVGSRAGRTKELTHVGITLTKPWRREVLVEHRKPSIAAQIAETMWVISGRDDIGWLEHYLPRARQFSDDGQKWRAGYGARLRSWPRREGRATSPIDQLRYVVDLLRKDPLSRQAVATIWDPQIDTAPGKDIPCNNWLSFSSRLGKLDLMVSIRSNDAIWGWSGINAFEWSALQEIVAGLLGLQVGGLHFSTTSFHLYSHHWTKAHRIVEASEMTFPPAPAMESPRFNGKCVAQDLETFDTLVESWFEVEKMIRDGDEVPHLVESFPEPMLQSWLRVLQWWWSGERDWLAELEGTALERATHYSIQPPEREQVVNGAGTPVAQFETHPGRLVELPGDEEDISEFLAHTIQTHNEKHEAYGDSWKRRGEMLGIMANIARKVDRLGGSETADETSADTAMDLFVYLAKYRVWLGEHNQVNEENRGEFDLSDVPQPANAKMRMVEIWCQRQGWPEGVSESIDYLNDYLTKTFDRLEDAVNRQDSLRFEIVESMLAESYVLARLLWEKQQEAEREIFLKRDAALQGDEYRGADYA